MLFKFPLYLLTFILFTVSAHAMPCHCFPTRAYDPGKPGAADPYFLTTTQNSFFAISFGLDKKYVVFAKQKPTSTAENLWIGYWVAQKLGVNVSDLLNMRRGTNSWKVALIAKKVHLENLPDAFTSLLNTGANDRLLSRFVVNWQLEEMGLASRQNLERLRQEGADDPETIIATIITFKTSQSSLELFRQVKKGETNWGSQLHKTGMDGGDMVKEIHDVLAKRYPVR